MPPDDLTDPSLVLPGDEITVTDLEPGTTVRFQCMIDPWMRSTVTVEPEHDDHSGQG
jgi:hypothetical protein